MATQKKTTTVTNKTPYNSNPFTLAFDAMSRMFNKNAPWAITVLVLALFGFFGQLGSNIASMVNKNDTMNSSYGTTFSSNTNWDVSMVVAVIVIVFVGILVFGTLAAIVSTYIQGMFSYVAIKSEQEKEVTFHEAFTATSKRFWRLFFAQLLAYLKIFGWTLLFIIPGIIAALRYRLLPYIIMSEPETETGISKSHDASKALVKGRLMEVFGIGTVATIVPILGTLLGLTGNAALYNQLSYYNKNKLEKPKIHWLNYLGLILLGVLALFGMMALFIAIVVLIAKNT